MAILCKRNKRLKVSNGGTSSMPPPPKFNCWSRRKNRKKYFLLFLLLLSLLLTHTNQHAMPPWIIYSSYRPSACFPSFQVCTSLQSDIHDGPTTGEEKEELKKKRKRQKITPSLCLLIPVLTTEWGRAPCCQHHPVSQSWVLLQEWLNHLTA